MPKATLTFNLPDEQSDYKLATKAIDMHLAIWDFTQLLRDKAKYGDDKPVAWDEVKAEWWQTLAEHGIDPYED